MNIYDVAKKAGVSIATVSRALNLESRSKVAPDTLKKVQRIANRHRYTPNVAAKSLSLAQFKAVGVLFPQLQKIFLSSYYSRLLSGVVDVLVETDYQFKMMMFKPDRLDWNTYDLKVGEGIDGLILSMHWRLTKDDKTIFERLGIPCVIVNDPDPRVKAHFVSCDNYAGGWTAAEYLYRCGHRKMGVVKGPEWSGDSRLRFLGFRSCLKKKGISLREDQTLVADFYHEQAYQKLDVFLRGFQSCTALFCLNDDMARGVLKRLRELGLACPKDISVVGFDDDAESAHTEPPLTTIYQPIYELAQEAAKLLIECLGRPSLAKKSRTYQRRILPVRLMERESVLKLI